MKATPSFKMAKSTKVAISHILDPHNRGFMKRKLIEAQLFSEIKPKSSKEDKKTETE